MRARTMALVRRFLCALPGHWGVTNLVGHGEERPTLTGYCQQICGACQQGASQTLSHVFDVHSAA